METHEGGDECAKKKIKKGAVPSAAKVKLSMMRILRSERDTAREDLWGFANKQSEHMARGEKLTEVHLSSARFI